MTPVVDPIVKWAGGKRRQLDQIRALVVERLAPRGTYLEPFLGGAAVALAMPDGVHVVASDACDELVRTYDAVRRRPTKVSDQLSSMVALHSRDHYYAVRALYNGDSLAYSPSARAAQFIYLNKAGFNGLYRVNRAGEFNVPVGRHRRVSAPSVDHLAAFSEVASSWRLASVDFEQIVDVAIAGDVVYADPPYDGTFDYASGFGELDQHRLAACLRRAARRGVGVVTTNADTPLVRRLYSWASVETTRERRTVAARSDRRESAPCVVAVRP